MSFVSGVNLLPATGEFTYDPTYVYFGQRAAPPGALLPINAYALGQASGTPDITVAIDQLAAAFPGCTTIAIVCAWFFNSEFMRLVSGLSFDDLHQQSYRLDSRARL